MASLSIESKTGPGVKRIISGGNRRESAFVGSVQQDQASARPRLRGEETARPLTMLERSLLWLRSLGWTNREIARLRGRSSATIKHEINDAAHRMGVRSTTEAVVKAWREGIIP